MVKTKLLLPTAAGVRHLRGLASPLRVYEHANNVLRSSVLFLASDDRPGCLRLSVEYEYVVFKFEIFNLVPKASVLPAMAELREVAVIADWNAIQCVVACAWQRPARPGEVSPSWEQIVGERGCRPAIPDTATAIGISMVGLIFHSLSQARPVGMIYSDDSDPSALSISRSPNQIQDSIANCETVAVEDFSRWKRDLLNWRNSLAADGRRRVRNFAK